MIDNELQRIQNHYLEDIAHLKEARLIDGFETKVKDSFAFVINQKQQTLQKFININQEIKKKWESKFE